MPGRIDPETGNLVDINKDQPRTYAEIQAIRPPCPRCGTPVSVKPIPLSSVAGSGTTQMYAFGRHQFNCNCFSG